jgi:hypothetical protein
LKQYEYTTRKIKKESELLVMGKEGWQLVSVDKGLFYFKRSLPNEFSTITNKGG